MIKILAACGAGINSSQQIKAAIETEMTERGYNVRVDTAVIKDITKEMLSEYDLFTPISSIDFSFETPIPTIEAGPILYRIPSMADPVFQEIEEEIKSQT